MSTDQMKRKAQAAREAAHQLAALPADTRVKALEHVAQALIQNQSMIFEANKKDLEQGQNNELEPPLMKRLAFHVAKLREVVDGIQALCTMDDPLNAVLMARELAPDLNLYRQACPIGVLAIIFESRPDALVQISALGIKSGNAIILKGGSEAMHTNRVLFDVIQQASVEAGLPDGWIALMESRADVNEMLSMDEDIDLIIPRGSNAFVKYIMDHSNIPVMGHADGICHTYVDQYADLAKAIPVCVDAKAQYVSVCNAMETLLVHQAVAKQFLPLLKQGMEQAHVELKGCARTQEIIDVNAADESDWDTEYLDYILSIRIVDSIDEAIAHIHQHGSGHTDVILTDNQEQADYFVARVDSAGVYVNASSRFADGFVYGLGAEVGISTSKFHARGPVGIEGLMTYKYILCGQYDAIQPFKSNERQFTHRTLDI